MASRIPVGRPSALWKCGRHLRYPRSSSGDFQWVLCQLDALPRALRYFLPSSIRYTLNALPTVLDEAYKWILHPRGLLNTCPWSPSCNASRLIEHLPKFENHSQPRNDLASRGRRRGYPYYTHVPL